MIDKELAKNIMYMIAAGDALGVPVEFHKRPERDLDPVSDYRAYGIASIP